MHPETIRRTLIQSAGANADSGAIAEATLSTWHQVAVRLVPVIGVRGVDALFKRSVHVTSKSYPWFALDGSGENVAALLCTLRNLIAKANPEEAVEVCHAFLVNFTELLTTLIGESLTARLLVTVWIPPANATEQEVTV